MARTVVALDADVLVPIVTCDFLLTAVDHGIYEPVVSRGVISEVERALVIDLPHLDRAAIHYRVEAMQDALDEYVVEEDLTVVPPTINVKDRHVVAAAVAGRAALLVTNDGRLRVEVEAADVGLRALSLDDFAGLLQHEQPEDFSAVIDSLVAKRARPPITRTAMIAVLRSFMPSIVG